MRTVVSKIFMIWVVLFACQEPEDLIPAPPAAETPTIITTIPENDDETADQDSIHIDSLQIDSAIYHAGKFRHMPYRILLPQHYDSSKTYPLLIFLHGIGERGTDNRKQLTWGSSLFQKDSIRSRYPAFIVFPQCPDSRYWFDKKQTETLKALADMLVKHYTVDKTRVFIGGLSMGAYGTYAMVAQYPELFSAAISISGDGDPHKATVMTKPRWRIFAGNKDQVVPSSKSIRMADALKKAGAKVDFMLYEDADHQGSWTNAFAESNFCSWLFALAKKDTPSR
jgi:predicted peptidase